MCRKKGLSGFQLKIIALVSMTVDHAAAFSGEYLLVSAPWLYDILRDFGRLAAPIFLYLTVEGARYTRNRGRYLLRLYIAGALVEAVNTVLELTVAKDSFADFGNMLPTLMYAVFYITLSERLIQSIRSKKISTAALVILGLATPAIPEAIYYFMSSEARSGLGGTALRVLMPSLVTLEYSFLFVLLAVAWYYINNKAYNCAFFVLLSVLSAAVDPWSDFLPWNFYELFLDGQWCMVFAAPLLLLYNGERGKSWKYGFYLYYPLHQYLIWFTVYLYGALQ